MKSKVWLILFVALAMVATACGDSDEGDGGGSTSCDLADLNLVTPGVLTVATSEPAFPPWMGVGDDNFDNLESGTGFEGALVYEIATELGFERSDVTWVRVGFNEAIAVGPKDVDFSVPYYTTTQALVTLADSPFASATSFADLKDAKLGAQIGTTSLAFVEDVIQPDTDPNVYDDNVDVEAAMNAGQIDGLVVDLPTAYFVTAVQVADSVIAAQFEAAAADPDNYGLLFESGNSLVGCVNPVLNSLKSNGTLASLETEWLEQGGGLTVISG